MHLYLFVKRYSRINTFFCLNFSLIWVVPLILTWAYFDGITPFLIDYFANKSKTFLIELPFSRKMETEADEVPNDKIEDKVVFTEETETEEVSNEETEADEVQNEET